MSGGAGNIKETPAEKAQAEIAWKQWGDFTTRWKPAQNQYIARVTQAYQPNKATAQGAASADVNAAFGNSASNATKALQQRGVGLGGSASKAAQSDLDTAQAASRGLSQVSAGQAADDQHFQQLEGLTAVGRGQQAAATAGYNTLANLSAQTARNDAQIAENNATAKGQFIGGLVGTAATLGGNYLNSKLQGSQTGGGLSKFGDFNLNQPGY